VNPPGPEAIPWLIAGWIIAHTIRLYRNKGSKMTPIKYVPVFSGKTQDDEQIVLYKNATNESELHIKRPDGELWALSHGSEVEMGFNPNKQLLQLSVRSPEWTGQAEGSGDDLLQERGLK